MSAGKVIIQRVAVVEFGVNDRSGDETGCFRRTDAAKSTDMRIAGRRECRDLIRENKVFVENKA